MGSISVKDVRMKIRVAVVCGDGLPISGLLTTLRNVIDLVPATEGCPSFIEHPIPTDLGYSWRIDKAEFFPRGPRLTAYPPWMAVSTATPILYPEYADDLAQIRRQVANLDKIDEDTQKELRRKIDKIAVPYEHYFSKWFEENQIDWVIAINMTLSDGVPHTQGLHKAGEARWGGGRPGGIVFWDHDLFGSASIIENGERIYPTQPNTFTPVPQDNSWQIWALASPVLALETEHYSTKLKPIVVPLVLPSFSPDDCDIRKDGLIQDFLTELDLLDKVLDGDRIILCPVRIFPVKGVEISIRLLAALNRYLERTNGRPCHLLVFGDVDEDLAYAAKIRDVIDEENTADKVVFLGGVPLGSIRDDTKVKLDEKDLLCLSAATGGGVFFTPAVPDVESVGLGPALATLAGVPCAITQFNAFEQVYTKDFHVVKLDPSSQDGYDQAAEEFAHEMKGSQSPTRGSSSTSSNTSIERNRSILEKEFPTRQWKELLATLASRAIEDQPTVQIVERSLGITQS